MSSGECANKCLLTFVNDISEHSDNKPVSYHIFERVLKTFYDKLSKETYLQPASVDKNATISAIAQHYMLLPVVLCSGISLGKYSNCYHHWLQWKHSVQA